MVWVRLPVYFYKRNETFYFSRAIPSDLQHRFNKRKIEVSLRTKSEAKAARSAAALSDRLERYWDSLRMEMIYSRELGLRIATTTVHSRVSQLSQVIIKLLVAKIIIKVLFLPVTPVTASAQVKIQWTKS